MYNATITQTKTNSILGSLRSLIPQRGCDDTEYRMVAEMQANKFSEIIRQLDPGSDGIQSHHLEDLSRIRIVHDPLPVSGLTQWNGKKWIIVINPNDSLARQRFTLLHEFKHIIDHGASGRLYRDTTNRGITTTSKTHSERAADYFAGCALIPRRDLKRAWTSGLQRVATLADHFGASEAAIMVRLDQTGLSRAVDPDPDVDEQPVAAARCAQPIRTAWGRPQEFQIRQPSYSSRGRNFA